MTPQPDKQIVVTPFTPDARTDVHDFRPVFGGESPDPKVESAPEPAAPAPAKKAPAKKAAAKKTAAPKTTTTAASEPIATVVEELPPA